MKYLLLITLLLFTSCGSKSGSTTPVRQNNFQLTGDMDQ